MNSLEEIKTILIKILAQVSENTATLTEVKRRIALIEKKYMLYCECTEEQRASDEPCGCL